MTEKKRGMLYFCGLQTPLLEIRVKKYLLTTLFNAPSTIDSYYTALVKHDLYGPGSHFYEDLGSLIKPGK